MKIKKFMASDKFVIVMNFIRIGTLIGVGILIFVIVKEIEAVKLLGYDVCKLCISKSGCECWCLK